MDYLRNSWNVVGLPDYEDPIRVAIDLIDNLLWYEVQLGWSLFDLPKFGVEP